MAVAVYVIMILLMPILVAGMKMLVVSAHPCSIISQTAIGKQPHTKNDHGKSAAALQHPPEAFPH